jgi:HNH endonuclease
MSTMEELLSEMRIIVPEGHYYALILTSLAQDEIAWSAYTHWVGWADPERRQEIREASLVRASHVADMWKMNGESYVVVNTTAQLSVYIRLGGNGLVEQQVAQAHLADVIGPGACVRSGEMGFRAVDSISEHEFKRAPTPKQRMRVLKRDQFRCRICGRRSSDYVDVELHVHHIRPWGKGGLTEDINLITLCHTCHRGLDPHEENDLFALLEPTSLPTQHSAWSTHFHANIDALRRMPR